MNVNFNFLARRTWHLVDARKQVVGRLATQLSPILMGKHKPTYSNHVDGGDYIVVVNAAELTFTGRKQSDKGYRWHSGFPGGLRERSPEEMQEKGFHGELLRRAVWGMLPKNKLRKDRMSRLLIYPGPSHPHEEELRGKVPINQVDARVAEEFDVADLEDTSTLPRSMRVFEAVREHIADTMPTEK